MGNNIKTPVLHRLLADDGYILQEINPTHGITIVRNKSQLSYRRLLTDSAYTQYINKLMQLVFQEYPCKSKEQYEEYKSFLTPWVDLNQNLSALWNQIRKLEKKLYTCPDCFEMKESYPEHPLIQNLNAQLHQINQALSEAGSNEALKSALPFHPTSIKEDFTCNVSAEDHYVTLLNKMIHVSKQFPHLLAAFSHEFGILNESYPELAKRILVIKKYIPEIPSRANIYYEIQRKIGTIEFLNQVCILNNTLVNGIPSCFCNLYSYYCEQSKKGTEESLFQFVWKFCQSMIPFGEYLYFSAARLLMAELISYYHNCHIADLTCTLKDDSVLSDTASEIHAITISGFENHFNGIIDFIRPLLSAISQYENIGYDEEFFFQNLRERLLYYISGCTSEKELRITPPSEELAEYLQFAEHSMRFIDQFQSALEQVSAGEQFKICIEIFASDRVKADYHSRQIWSSRILSKKDKPIDIALLFAKSKILARNAQTDSTNREHIPPDTGSINIALKDTLGEGLVKDEQIQVTNYSTITLLALEESIKNYVTHYRFPDRPLKPYYTWCKRCNRMMVKTRKNTFYCLLPQQGEKQSCAKLMAHQKNSQKITPADRIWKSILNKMSYMRNTCPVELQSKTKNLIANIMASHYTILSQWRSHQLSDDEYICEIRKLGDRLK